MSERTRNVLDDVQSGSFSPNTENGPPLHPATADLVSRFMGALAEKLAAAEAKYGYSDGWADPAWQEECRRQLHHHAAKGDPRDVAAYAAFCWHHGWSTSDPSQAGNEDRILDRVARAWGLLWASVADGHTRSGHNVQSARRVLGNLLTQESKRGGIAMLSDDELIGPDDTMAVSTPSPKGLADRYEHEGVSDREGHGTERPQASPQPRDEPLSLPSPDNTNPKAGAPEHG